MTTSKCSFLCVFEADLRLIIIVMNYLNLLKKKRKRKGIVPLLLDSLFHFYKLILEIFHSHRNHDRLIFYSRILQKRNMIYDGMDLFFSYA